MLREGGEGWGANFYVAWLHTYSQKGRGFTEREMGFFSTFPFIIGAVANGFGGSLSDALVRKSGLKWGRRLPRRDWLDALRVLPLAHMLHCEQDDGCRVPGPRLMARRIRMF